MLLSASLRRTRQQEVTQMNKVSKNIKGLQVQSFSPRVRLTKGQSALLKSIRKCVEGGTSISWDIIVDIFYNNVNKVARDSRYIGSYLDGTGRYEYFNVDIKKAYEAQNSKWQYCIKPRVRQWFVSSIGILVVKNQLIVIPTIEIDEPARITDDSSNADK